MSRALGSRREDSRLLGETPQRCPWLGSSERNRESGGREPISRRKDVVVGFRVLVCEIRVRKMQIVERFEDMEDSNEVVGNGQIDRRQACCQSADSTRRHDGETSHITTPK